MNLKEKIFWIKIYTVSTYFIYFSTLVFGHECPSGWEDFEYSCYKFSRPPNLNRDDALIKCQDYNSNLLSVNTYKEHIFISNWLLHNDPYHHRWYTSGLETRNGSTVWQEYEDVQNTNDQFLWIPEQKENTSNGFAVLDDIQEFKRYIAYNFSTILNQWGVTKVHPSEELRYICEIHKEKLNQIIMERDLDYGVIVNDKKELPRGPYILEEPEDEIFDLNGRQTKNYVSLKCVAGGYPLPLYKWYKHKEGLDSAIYINPLADNHFSQTDGILTIHNPSINVHYGKYSCAAFNRYGLVVSHMARLSLEYLDEFKRWRSPDYGKEGWGKALVCDYPHYQSVQHFNWARNFFPQYVQEDERVFVSKDGTLYFSSLEKADSANYSCAVKTKSSTGRFGPFFYLGVKPPTHGQKLAFAYSFPKSFPSVPIIGTNITLECMAFGYPIPSYSWSRTSPTNNLPAEAYTENYNRVLIIPAFTIEDCGVYVCTARNEYEIINKSIQLGAQAFPAFTIPLDNQVVDIGAMINWTCEAFGIPSVTYSWLKNGVELHVKNLTEEDGNHYSIIENKLTIIDVNEKHEGMYQCKASNILGDRYSSGQLKIVRLAPTFQKYPLEKEMYAIEGGEVIIPCRPEAAPFPEIVWKFNKKVLQTRKIKRNGYLYINPVKTENQGLYTCLASNQYGSSESNSNLIVLPSPTMYEVPPPNITAVVNDSVEIQCQAHVSPLLEAVYVWFHNGLKIDFTKRHQFMIGSHSGYLIISRIQLANAGSYTCGVKTSFSKISATTELLIVGPPGAPGGVYAEFLTATNGTIMWSDGSENGGRIIGYTIEGKTNHNQKWHILVKNATNWRNSIISQRKEISLHNVLSPWSTYRFRVSAINIYGKGSPSDASPLFDTLEYPPLTAPRNVGGGGGKIGDLTITWDPLSTEEWNSPKLWYKIYYKPNSKRKFFVKNLKHLEHIGMYTVFVGEENYYKKYIVKVQAINNLGKGPISQEAVIYSAEKAIQIQPSEVKAVPFNSTSLNVSWNPIELNQPGGVRGKLLGYRIKYWEGSFNETDAIIVLQYGLNTSGLIVGLWPNTEYWVKVMAYNDAGSGMESEKFLGRTLKWAPQRMPSNVKIKAMNPTTLKVTWRGIITSADEEAIIGYKVRYWEANQDMTKSKEVIKLLDGKDLEVTVSDLVPGKEYQLRVLAYSSGGDGKMSYPAIKFVIGDVKAMGYETAGTNYEILNSLVLLFELLMLYFLQ